MQMLILILTLLLTSCAPTRIVQVPINNCPKPTITELPHLPVSNLTETSLHSEVMRAYVASLLICKQHDEMIMKQLEGYR